MTCHKLKHFLSSDREKVFVIVKRILPLFSENARLSILVNEPFWFEGRHTCQGCALPDGLDKRPAPGDGPPIAANAIDMRDGEDRLACICTQLSQGFSDTVGGYRLPPDFSQHFCDFGRQGLSTQLDFRDGLIEQGRSVAAAAHCCPPSPDGWTTAIDDQSMELVRMEIGFASRQLDLVADFDQNCVIAVEQLTACLARRWLGSGIFPLQKDHWIGRWLNRRCAA